METVVNTEQMNIFGCINDQYKIKKPIRLIELFAGIGSQAKALERLGTDFEHYKAVEFDKFAIKSYNAIHGTNFETSDITQIHASDLGIKDTDQYEYIMTYSFPCQDLSLAGKQKGMSKGSNTRSGLLWEVERLLDECEELPQVLLMENVPQVIGKKNIEDFRQWQLKLESLGYSNFIEVLNAKDYGIPQNRKRCFMVSILGNYGYEFPKPFELKLRLKDMLEDEVDEKYYLSKKVQDRLIITDPTFTKSVIGTTKPKCRTIGQRDLVYQEDSVMGTLVATDYKQPKQILESRRIGGLFDTEKSKHQAGSIWDINGLSPTLDTMQGGYRQPCIPIKNATKKGYVEANVGDSINLEQPNSKARRGRVGKGVAQTLTTSCNQAVVEPFKIRKLTPLECWRLMGFDDDDCIKASEVNSNTQLYKQAGNSIVVNVLYYIFKQML